MVEKTRIVIIGAGIAGAATAYALVRRGVREIVILEKELLPGTHSSGRNAAMMRQNVPEEINCRLAMQSMPFFAAPPRDFPFPLDFHRTGSMILASGKALADMRASAAMQRRVGLEVLELSPQEAVARVPILDARRFEAALLCPSDGTLDIHGLLQGFLRYAQARGAQLRRGTQVLGLQSRAGRIAGVRTNRGDIEAEWVINAAGAWASAIPGIPAPAPQIRACRRHLAVTKPILSVSRDWPFTWDISGGFYFRPESGGILMSPCDEEEIGPCNSPVDAARIEETAEKALRLLPSLGEAQVAHAWSGLRNLTADHLFLVGEDERMKGLFWVAGLGGHGMTASPALAEVAADLLLEGHSERIDTRDLRPHRFAQASAVASEINLAREALL